MPVLSGKCVICGKVSDVRLCDSCLALFESQGDRQSPDGWQGLRDAVVEWRRYAAEEDARIELVRDFVQRALTRGAKLTNGGDE